MHSAEFLPIEPARVADAPAVAALIDALAPRFLAEPRDDVERARLAVFRSSVDARALADIFASRTTIALVARTRAGVVGYGALRDGTHLLHLFVDAGWQRRGLGRRLWQALRESARARGDRRAAEHGHTLNASPGAVPVCERFGFVACEPARHRPPLTFQPMRRPPDAHD